MRLTCPNCEAQYEVPDEVIPTSGRDVQCSDCSTTWFQHHPDHMPEAQEDASGDSAPARRELDPAVADVLREEAEREAAARAAERETGLETQPDLGLGVDPDDTAKRAREAQGRMARIKGKPDPERPMKTDTADDGPHPGPRSNLLPDIEEINSSLNSETTDIVPTKDRDAYEDPLPESGGGFMRGFTWTIVVAGAALALYAYAPHIGQSVPALEGALGAYVQVIDQGRDWLAGMYQP